MDRVASREPRRPQDSPLHRIVRGSLETFLEQTRLSYERPLPRYVEDELRRYLRCGIPAHGFVRLECPSCGHESIVAFSCKGRGLCPSCAGRRMSNTAAHLVDRVLPAVPIRQWVLSIPFELRRLAAFRADVLRTVARIFAEVVFGSIRRRSHRRHAACGAINFVHRGGGSLNLHVHLHMLVLDGFFESASPTRVVFHRLKAPFPEDIADVASRTCDRVLRWLRRKGLIEDPHATGEAPVWWPDADALDACGRMALKSGGLSDVEDGSVGAGAVQGEGEERRFHPRSSDRWSARVEGFNVHAGVRIAASEDEARERLCRYGTRPTLALSRLSILRDGSIAYRVKNPQGPNSTHRVMSPLELMARIAALIPPPRYPLVRYHGVLAPNSPWRRSVVPRPPDPPRPCGHAPARHLHSEAKAVPDLTIRNPAGITREPRPDLEAAARRLLENPIADGVEKAFDRISPAHWKRLEDGALLARSPRIDWATLFRRTFLADPLACDRCGARMRPVEIVTDEDIARRMLEKLGMPADVPDVSPARSPDEMSTGPPDPEPEAGTQICLDESQLVPDYDISQ